MNTLTECTVWEWRDRMKFVRAHGYFLGLHPDALYDERGVWLGTTTVACVQNTEGEIVKADPELVQMGLHYGT